MFFVTGLVKLNSELAVPSLIEEYDRCIINVSIIAGGTGKNLQFPFMC